MKVYMIIEKIEDYGSTEYNCVGIVNEDKLKEFKNTYKDVKIEISYRDYDME